MGSIDFKTTQLNPKTLVNQTNMVSYQMNQDQITKMFNELDRNNDQKLDQHEIFQVLQKSHPKTNLSDAHDFISQLDTNNDGFLDVTEFGKMIEIINKKKELLRQQFNYFDTDSDGFIDYKELKKGLVRLNMVDQAKKKNVKKMIKDADKNGD